MRRRCSGQPGGKARDGGGGAPEAGEDGAEEEDGEEADERSMGIRSLPEAGAGRGGSRSRWGADDGGPAAWWGARASADFGRPVAAENHVGQRTGGAAEGGDRGG
jgi:hypothetical protein